MEKGKTFEIASAMWKMEAYSINRLAEVACDQSIDQVVEILTDVIRQKKRILTTGQGHSGIAARHLAFNMYMLNGCANFISLDEGSRHVQTLSKGDVLVLISKNGSNDRMIQLLKIAHERDVTVVGVTQNPASPLGMWSDIMLRILVVRNTQPTDSMSLVGSSVLLSLLDGITVAVEQALNES